jgi:hypothetical protein
MTGRLGLCFVTGIVFVFPVCVESQEENQECMYWIWLFLLSLQWLAGPTQQRFLVRRG